MPRPAVLAEQFAGSKVGISLREHREDRAALLASLTESLKADPRVRAVWLWGSFQNGEADDLSDIDLWIIVTEEAVSEMGPILLTYAERTENYICGGEAPYNAPPHGGYFASRHKGRHGLLFVDSYWQALSAMETSTEFFPKSSPADRIYLIDRRDVPPTSTPEFSAAPKPAAPLTQRENEIVDGINFAWLMFSIAGKYLARFPDSDMGLMQYPRPGLENAAALLGMETALRANDWAVPARPDEKLVCLRHLAQKVAQITMAANKQGVSLSRLQADCAGRYWDLIEGILSERKLQL